MKKEFEEAADKVVKDAREAVIKVYEAGGSDNDADAAEVVARAQHPVLEIVLALLQKR